MWLAAWLVLAQTPQPAPQTFRSGTQLVEVDVRVLENGRFVADLGPGDFRILEDGVPQQIQSVTLIGAPGTPARVAPAPSAPPAALAPLARPPSVWIFLFDTPHLTPGPFERARDAAAKFLAGQFRAGDIGGVIADGKMANNRLTSDRAELTAALRALGLPAASRSRQLEQREWPRVQDEFEAASIVNNDQEAIRTAVIRACADDPDACRRAPPDMQVMEKARRMVEASRRAASVTLTGVNALSSGLARMPGAKTVVLFSEGFVVQQVQSELRAAAAQAARAGARFYAIDARGLNTGSGSQIIDQPLADSHAGPTRGFDPGADGTNSLAVDTGGMAIRNENNFARALQDIQRDADTYYVIAYAPANAAFDGKYRAIDVTVARPGVKVRARRGYLAVEPARLLVPRPMTPAAAIPDVPVSPGALALREDIGVSLPEVLGSRDARGAPERGAEPAVRARIDTGAMVLALGKEPARADTPASRGWSAYERGDVETASRELGEAARSAGARPWVLYALGLSQFALHRYAEAAQSWERVRRDVPGFEPVYFNLADAYTLQHEDGTALKVLRDGEGRWPEDAEVANAIGVIHVRRGALDAAIASFERATKVAPADGLGYFNLARTHQMRLLKAQRYDRHMEKWIGGDDDRRRAIANFEKYLQIGGAYERQAREALAALSWK